MNKKVASLAESTAFSSAETSFFLKLWLFQHNFHHNLLAESVDNDAIDNDATLTARELKKDCKKDDNLPEKKYQFGFLAEAYKQELEIQEALLGNRKKWAARYESLFNKYDQKLKNPHLTDRQRNRYQKLWIQYAQLYAQYCHN